VKRSLKFVLVTTLFAGLLPLAGTAQSAVKCPTGKPPKLDFGQPTFIDKTRAGGEPVSVVAEDGSITVSAHAGTTHVYKNPEAAPGAGDFASSYYNQTLNWRSEDGGESWQYIGLAGSPVGPHSGSSTGFSDPDLAIDGGGNLYNTEIDLANVSVFASPDDGQSWPTANPAAASGDRPWLTGGDEDGEVYLYVNSPKQLWRSTDMGLTFSLVSTSFPADGKMILDPLKPKTGLIGPSGSGVAISPDEGKTWKDYPGKLGKSTQFFGAIAVDRAGWIYAASAGGYAGSTDTDPNGQVAFNYFNRKTKKWASTPVSVPIPRGDALWPWIIAGDDGRVALVWLQTLGGNPDKFYIYAAYTTNGHGSKVRCSDGSTKFVPPQFSVANASGRPMHEGKICLSGTTCNANPNFEGGDRRLGDFLTVNFDRSGNIFIASGDTTLKSPTGGPKPVSNPIFIKQSDGDKMLKSPDKTRKTRCLFPQPSC
jgi:hypothetical protein